LNKTKIIGLISLVLSYLFLIITFIYDSAVTENNYFFYVAWFLGIISVISNTILADKIKIKKWIFILFIFCGILWLFPPLLITYFGIPCMIIYLIIGILIQRKIYSTENKKTA
jgi:hypothetical protein